MPLTLVGMTRVFLDDMDRGPSGVSNQDDIQDIDTVTSSVSAYALSDDGIDEADFALEKEGLLVDEEEEPSSTGLMNLMEESRIHEPAMPDETSCHDHSTIDGLRTPAPMEGDRCYPDLPSILVTEIDDMNVPRNSNSDARNNDTCILFEPYPTKARTRMFPPKNNGPTMSARGAKEGEPDVAKCSYQQGCQRC